jgi:hypothetical protein
MQPEGYSPQLQGSATCPYHFAVVTEEKTWIVTTFKEEGHVLQEGTARNSPRQIQEKKMYEHSCRNSRTLELLELGTHSYTKLTANYEVEGWRSCEN